MIPKAVTLELIQTCPAIFRSLSMYINETRHHRDRTAPADYPAGLRDLLKVVELENSIQSYGLWGYLADVTSTDGTVNDVEDVIHLLWEMQATRSAMILEEAFEVWKEFLASYVSAWDGKSQISFEEFQVSREIRDAMEAQLDPLDDEYFAARGDLAEAISQHVRKHPQAFIHPV